MYKTYLRKHYTYQRLEHNATNISSCFVTHQIQDQPLHPDPDLVANILGSRPDASSSTLADSLSPITTPKAPGQTKPLLPSSCGGEVIAKVNEVDTLLSPGTKNVGL